MGLLPKFIEHFLEASLLAFIEALFDSIEKIEATWCYIRGIWRMRYSCELFYSEKFCGHF
jgi:hypothetical protein